MGRSLAAAFVAAGHPTTVWNRTPGKTRDLVAAGATEAPTAAEAVAASPLVIVCVLDDNAVQAIVEPVADSLRGRLLVNLTADSPDRARQLADWAGDHGIDYLDGAIMTPTGTIGTPAASVLYSGPRHLYDDHLPTLQAIGGAATHLGTDPGRAAAHEVALLDLFWTSMSGLVHAFALARAEGILAGDLAPYAGGIGRLLPDIATGMAAELDAGVHPGADSNITSAAAGMDHIIHTTEQHGIDAAVLRAVRALAQRAIDAGRGDEGFGLLADVLASRRAQAS